MTSAVQHRSKTQDRITLAADCYDHDDARPVVLLLHGGGQNRHAWSASASSPRMRIHSRRLRHPRSRRQRLGPSRWYDLERLATDLLAVREHFSADIAPAVVGASLGGMTVLGTHLLTSGASWAAVVLVDVTPRLEFQGARRVVTFMAAHPDGFGTLDDAAEVIAALQPPSLAPGQRRRPTQVLRQRHDGRWIWRWDPAFIHSNFDFLRDESTTGTEQFDAISHLLIDGADGSAPQHFS